MRRSRKAAWLILLAALAGCQGLGQLAEEFDPRQRPEQKAYEEAIAPYLRLASVYHGPAVELKAAVLPLTPAVRQALARREAAARGWDQAGLDKRLTEHQGDADLGLEVMVSLYAPEKGRAELAGAKADWRVALLGPAGEQHNPTDTRSIRDRTALHEALYPFWGSWDRLYRLRFSPAPAGGEAVLVIVGAPGRTEVRLKLD